MGMMGEGNLPKHEGNQIHLDVQMDAQRWCKDPRVTQEYTRPGQPLLAPKMPPGFPLSSSLRPEHALVRVPSAANPMGVRSTHPSAFRRWAKSGHRLPRIACA